MWYEVKNKNGTYPFSITSQQLAGLSVTAAALVNSIKTVKLFVLSAESLQASLISVDSSGLQIQLQGQSIHQVCQCSFEGGVSGSIIDTANSYIQFCSSPAAYTGNYNLPLLPQVLCYVPVGLKLYCKANPIQEHAQIYECRAGEGFLYNMRVKFLDGKNCSVYAEQNSIIFAGGANNGKGKFSEREVTALWGKPAVVEQPVQSTKGLLSINGQGPDINFQTSAGLTLSLNQGTRVLTFGIQRASQ